MAREVQPPITLDPKSLTNFEEATQDENFWYEELADPYFEASTFVWRAKHAALSSIMKKKRPAE